jgi:DoxX-like family
MAAPGTMSRGLRWLSYFLSALPASMMLFASYREITRDEPLATHFAKDFGYDAKTMLVVGCLDLLCVILYVIPQTAVLGLVLTTGYMGAAIATHVRIGDWAGFPFPVALILMAWGGLYLREPRLRALLPLRRP